MSSPAGWSLLDPFSALKDPRQSAKVVYPRPEVVLLVLSAMLAGADDLVETVLWSEEHPAFPRRLYRDERGIPSHDTLCDVFAALNPDLFKACFLAWIGDLRDSDPEIIAIDGKTSRRSHDRGKGRNPQHLVSASCCSSWFQSGRRQRIVLAQQATEEKSNEITAIPVSQKPLDLTGALVTIDAMGTRTEIARAIRDGGGDYGLSLKWNWPAVHAEVEHLFDDPANAALFETEETVEQIGGRIETRRHTVCHWVDRMTSDRRYSGGPVFPDLAMTTLIETAVERNGKTECETRYCPCSLAMGASMFARAARAHWGVENRLHWVSMSYSATTWHASEPAMDNKTWPSCDMPRSTCPPVPNQPSA